VREKVGETQTAGNTLGLISWEWPWTCLRSHGLQGKMTNSGLHAEHQGRSLALADMPFPGSSAARRWPSPGQLVVPVTLK